MVERMYTDPLLVDFYDALCRGRSDFDFYLPLVMSADSVLDVGCGTGWLLRLARLHGHTGVLCGVDPSSQMLAHAGSDRDVEWVLGTPLSMECRERFSLVVMTGHAFQTLVGDEELRATLAAIRRALTQDGRFVFEVRHPSVREWESWHADNTTRLVSESGRSALFWREFHPPVDGDVVSYSAVYSGEDWSGPRVSRGRLRYLDPVALSSFLGDAGLVVREQFGDWGREPLTATSSEIITVATPAA